MSAVRCAWLRPCESVSTLPVTAAIDAESALAPDPTVIVAPRGKPSAFVTVIDVAPTLAAVASEVVIAGIWTCFTGTTVQ